MSVHAIILAAGQGTRLPSSTAKPLQRILGESMVSHVYNSLLHAGISEITLIIGHRAQDVQTHIQQEFGQEAGSRCVLQAQQLGTGHAVACAMPALQEKLTPPDRVLVVNADMPLLTPEIFQHFLTQAASSPIAFMTLELDDPASYGRVLRDEQGNVTAIVEAKDFALAYPNAIVKEINAGIYLFDFPTLTRLLPLLSNKNASKEYYLTDLIKIGKEQNIQIQGICAGTSPALLGVNTPAELLCAETIMQERRVRELLAAGVILHSAHDIRVSPFATIDKGAELYGPCEIYGTSHVESGVVLESHCVLHSTHIGANTKVRSFCHFEDADIAASCTIGPFARLRPGADLAESVHIGNFVEIKKSSVGLGSKVNHLTYIGDTTIGSGVNVGAGSITCNYDGKHKFHTEIGDGAFLGSNCALVAPVSVGKNALVAAGSVITKNVPDNALAFGRSRQVNTEKKLKSE